MIQKKVFFVTGGAGFLGINLVRYLLGKGHKVVSFDIAPFDYPEKDQITPIMGDIRDIDCLMSAMRGADVVVHCAAALPLYSQEDIFSTDLLGTTYVLAAAKALGVERTVYISSTAVYGVPDHHPLYEADPMHGVGPYGEAKVLAEEMCQLFRQDGMCVPVLRPKSFVGPERLGVFALFYDWARQGHGFPMIGSGENRYQLLDVEDLCQAIWLVAALPREKVNDVFNIGAREYRTMKEDYQAVLDYAGFGKKIVSLPETPVILALKVLEKLRLSPLYKWVYETASKDSFVSIEKAERVLGYDPVYSNQQALIRNYRWYLDNLHTFENQSGVSHRVPWNQGILALARRFF
ncbi:MAG: NAD-dependent epimerase/dehydratase family protein [Armatimonadetes bacterium]|nr:NAD-dependent epimerase/dehydratase family protein [Armatimonadota bacterium]